MIFKIFRTLIEASGSLWEAFSTLVEDIIVFKQRIHQANNTLAFGKLKKNL